jgi:hypothetical protein
MIDHLAHHARLGIRLVLTEVGIERHTRLFHAARTTTDAKGGQNRVPRNRKDSLQSCLGERCTPKRKDAADFVVKAELL